MKNKRVQFKKDPNIYEIDAEGRIIGIVGTIEKNKENEGANK